MEPQGWGQKNSRTLTDGRAETTGPSSSEAAKTDEQHNEACLGMEAVAAPSVLEKFYKVSIFVRICTNKNLEISTKILHSLKRPFPAGALAVWVLWKGKKKITGVRKKPENITLTKTLMINFNLMTEIFLW